MGYVIDPDDPKGWRYIPDGPIEYGGATDWASPHGLRYSRFVAAGGSIAETEAHVRAHLSSIADSDDDPDTHAADVEISYWEADGGTLIVGFLPGAQATAPYLQPGHDPWVGVDPQLRREVLGG